MKTRLNSMRPLIPALIASLVGACTGTAWGQGSSKSYSVTHAFNLHTPGNLAPAVFLNHLEHVTARTNGCKGDLKDGPGSIAIGAGASVRTQTVGPFDSTATANSRANITTLVAGNVAGTITGDGVSTASVDGCPTPAPRRSYGHASAYSVASVSVRGRYLDSRGNIRWSGGWRNSGSVSGSSSRSAAKDPVVLKVMDNTTGISSEWTLISIRSTAGGGESAWENGVVSNTAQDCILDISLGAPITVQQGHLRLVAEHGVVTESIATGVFAGTALPPVGGLPTFAAPLPELSVDFDAGADPNHDIDSEVILDGSGESEAEAAFAGD